MSGRTHFSCFSVQKHRRLKISSMDIQESWVLFDKLSLILLLEERESAQICFLRDESVLKLSFCTEFLDGLASTRTIQAILFRFRGRYSSGNIVLYRKPFLILERLLPSDKLKGLQPYGCSLFVILKPYVIFLIQYSVLSGLSHHSPYPIQGRCSC